MIGLVMFFVFALYIGALIGLPLLLRWLCSSKFNAPRSGKWLGWGSFFAIFMAGFGITLLTYGVHRFSCSRNADVTVFQTAEQWAKAHPNELAEAIPYATTNPRRVGELDVWELSDRFEWRVHRHPLAVHPIVHEDFEQLIDRKTGEVMLEKRDYFIPGAHPGEFPYGFWLAERSCDHENIGVYFMKAFHQFERFSEEKK